MSAKTSGAALLLLGSVAVGCNEPPSFRTRWCVDPRDGESSCGELLEANDGAGTLANTAATLCSHAGVREVEIVTFDPAVPSGDGLGQRFVDRRIHPCSPKSFADPTATVDGPRLDAGTYRVMIRGMNGEQRGWFTDEREPVECTDDGQCQTGYTCEPASSCASEPCPSTCQPQVVFDDLLWCSETGCVVEESNQGGYETVDGVIPGVCACEEIEILGGDTTLTPRFELPPPPDCEDGIDNDRDGLVDSIDPGCTSAGIEAAESERVQLSIEITLLDENPNATCNGLGIGSFVARLSEENEFTIRCNERPVPANLVVVVQTDPEGDDDTRTLTVVGLGPDGAERTVAKEITFATSTAEPLRIDFGADDFVSPIEARAPLPLRFEHDPAGLRPTVLRGCDNDSGRFGRLEIADVRITMLDGHGGPLPSPVRLLDGTPLDGSVLACPTSILRTEPLQWGSYLVQVDAATADGTVCYSTDPAKHPEGRVEPVAPIPAAPLESSALVVPRIYEIVEVDVDDDGNVEEVARPPSGCEDCDPAQETGCGEGNRCIQGICVPNG